MKRGRLGVDLGGTSVKLAMVTAQGKIIKEGQVETGQNIAPRRLVTQIFDVVNRWGVRPSRIGVGVAGDIDAERGVVRISPNLGWKNVPLKTLFQRDFRCPVEVQNDATAAAWGVFKTLVPPSTRNLVVLTLGTGVGGGLVLNGELFTGATGSAGEIGHLNIETNGPRCHCGLTGCLEAYVGGPYLAREVRNRLESGERSTLRGVETLSAKVIAEAAKSGDALARSLFERAGWALGVAIGDLAYLLNPERVVFTGGIAQSASLFLPSLKKALAERPFQTPIRAARLQVAAGAAKIGVIGASLL